MPAAAPLKSGNTMALIRAAILRIPRGKVATYGQVAAAAGFPRAARVVVRALQQAGDRLPWHRVVGAGGRIRLPGTAGLEQRLRLEAEGVAFRGARIRMEAHEFPFTASARHRPSAPAR